MILRFQEGLGPAEIAEVLEMPVNTVKSTLYRSLADLCKGADAQDQRGTICIFLKTIFARRLSAWSRSGFTQRVMARVNQAKAEGPVEIKREPGVRNGNGVFLAWWKLRPAWSFALVVILLLAFGVGGYQYSE